jgi:hypothetical protein
LVVVAMLVARAGFAEPSVQNLRVEVRCAYYLATPRHGMQLTVDGVPQAGVVDLAYSEYTDSDGNLQSTAHADHVGFDVAPGTHHLVLETPDCAPVAQDVAIAPDHFATLTGRMAISNGWLQGPVGAPNGWGVLVGGFYAQAPSSSGINTDDETEWAANPAPTEGLLLGLSFERRFLALGFDWGIGGGTESGIALSTAHDMQPESSAFTQSYLHMMWRGRIGARLPLGMVSLAAGSGLGAEIWISTAATYANKNDYDLGLWDAIGGFFLPMWASVTFKPSCGFGIEALGSYDVHPLATSADAFSLGVGLVYQPSRSCDAPVGITTTAL